jgi:hypothetical protein
MNICAAATDYTITNNLAALPEYNLKLKDMIF